MISTIIFFVVIGTVYDIVQKHKEREKLDAILEENEVTIQHGENVTHIKPQEIESLIKIDHEESMHSLFFFSLTSEFILIIYFFFILKWLNGKIYYMLCKYILSFANKVKRIVDCTV